MPVWRLPDHVADVLPAEARKLESLRRTALDVFQSYGYELVQPPLLEYLDSLLTGIGKDLDLQTFKLIDQISGRTLGLRADITPQTARIDAHLLNRQGVTRLAYCGPVLHTRPRSASATREPLALGAELYGHAGIEADLESLDLLLDCLKRFGVGNLTLSLSHAGVLRHLLLLHGVNAQTGAQVAACLQSKDRSGLAALELHDDAVFDLSVLFDLCGQPEHVLPAASDMVARHPAMRYAFGQLALVAAHCEGRASLLVDMADSQGYEYHTGLTFAVLTAGVAGALARGGRYDTVGEMFGRARAATGFSMDLRELAQNVAAGPKPRAITSAWSSDPKWQATVAALRQAGETVLVQLPGDTDPHAQFTIEMQLATVNGRWQVVALPPQHPNTD
jgi:ATP phosphoribosyltransferase regulatory subunit